MTEWYAVPASDGGVALVPLGCDEPDSRVRVADGALVGTDGGEWGGSVSWVSADGASSYEIVEGNIKGLHARGSRIVALAGAAMVGGGTIYELELDARGRWQVAHRTVLEPTSPEALAAAPSGGLLIAADDGLLRYDRGQVTRLHTAAPTWPLPSSVVVTKDGVIYVGMRFGVARLTPRDGQYVEEFLVPPDCASIQGRRRDEDGLETCHCADTTPSP
jgi:hypothetical protein